MYAFTYHQPEQCRGGRRAPGSEDAKLLAGGQTLLPTMKQRLASPASLVDLGKIERALGHQPARATRSSSAR